MTEKRTLAALIFAAAIVGGCGTLTGLAYDDAPLMVRSGADEYLGLNESQKTLLRPRIAAFHAWHRRHELPRYADLAETLGLRIDAGLSDTDIAWALEKGSEYYRRLASQAVDEALPALMTLTPANIQALDRKLAASTDKLEQEYLGGEPIQQHARRLRAVRKPLEDWLGELNAEQRAIIEKYVRVSPQFMPERFTARRQRNQELVQLMRAYRGTRELGPQLKRHLLAQEADHLQRRKRSVAELLVVIDRSLSVPQRNRIVARLTRYATEFDALAAVAKDDARSTHSGVTSDSSIPHRMLLSRPLP